MSKICPKCGRELQDQSIVCVNCGQRMDAVEPLAFEAADSMPKEAEQPQLSEQSQTPPPEQPQTPPPEQPQTPPPVQMQTPPLQQADVPMKQSGLGIASFVLGIIGLLSCGLLMIPEVLAIVFGLVGIKDKNHKRGLAIAGTILGVISVIGFIAMVLYSIFADPGFAPFGADTVGWLYIVPVAIAIGGITLLIIKIMRNKIGAFAIIREIVVTVATVAFAAFVVSIVNNNVVVATNTVRDAYPLSIPNITYGQAIDNFCGDVKWTTFKSKLGYIYIQATGTCMYQEKEQNITIQFETNSMVADVKGGVGEAFRVSWIGFGEEKRSYDEMAEFLYTMFENYADKNGIELNEDQKDGILMNQAYLDSQEKEDTNDNSDNSTESNEDGVDSNGFYEE